MSTDTVLMTGNHAVAWGARLARPQVVPVYPITPQTPVLEKLTEFEAAGEFQAEIIAPESEHSVMSACIPASLTGARVFTATASQGLLLMHELLHYAAGARAPIVMANVNRTVASPWAFWPDHTDSLSQRDTGWIQLYVESAQEALDSVILAYRVAEESLLPAMVNLDAFYISHSLEPVALPSQAQVDGWLPPFDPPCKLDTAAPASWGNVIGATMFARHRHEIEQAMQQVPDRLENAAADWARLTGRRWGVLERYRCDDAEAVLVCLGSMNGSAREAVDALREQGVAVGLVKLMLFRPFPVEALRAALAGVRLAIVLDRNHSPGCGGILLQELRAALYGVPHAPVLRGWLAGVGGVSVPPETIAELVRRSMRDPSATPSPWVLPGMPLESATTTLADPGENA